MLYPPVPRYRPFTLYSPISTYRPFTLYPPISRYRPFTLYSHIHTYSYSLLSMHIHRPFTLYYMYTDIDSQLSTLSTHIPCRPSTLLMFAQTCTLYMYQSRKSTTSGRLKIIANQGVHD